MKLEFYHIFHITLFLMSFYSWAFFLRKIYLTRCFNEDVMFVKNKLDLYRIDDVVELLTSQYEAKKPATMLIWAIVQNYEILSEVNLPQKNNNKKNTFSSTRTNGSLNKDSERDTFSAKLYFHSYIFQQLFQKANAVIYSHISLLESGLNYLESIGSLSLFIGLLGTVFGFMTSIKAMGSDVQIQQLASLVAESLMTTAMSLMVAIPASLFYNILQAKIFYFREMLNIIAQDAIFKLAPQDLNDDNNENDDGYMDRLELKTDFQTPFHAFTR